MAHSLDPASDPPSATPATAAMPSPASAVGVWPVPAGRRQPRRRASSLYARIVGLNAAILAAAALALALTPVTVSSPVTISEWIILGVGVIGLVAANAVLLKISFSGLTALVQRMETLDVLLPTERLPEMGGAETRALIAGINTMLGRLEAERRASMRSTISGQEAERQRIGRELHDEIGQRLTGILLQLGRIHDEAPSRLRTRVEGVQDQARAALDETGALAYQMLPGVLNDLGLLSGLDALADSFRQNEAAVIDSTLPDQLPTMATEVELAIYRIAQEALTNAVRHSGAAHVAVGLQSTDSELTLQVADDGRGLSGPDVEGQGIRGMRERAMLIHGSLRIDSQPPRGLRVSLTVPASNLKG